MALHSRHLVLAVVAATSCAVHPAWAAWQKDGVPVCVNPATQIDPVMIADGSGGAIIVWEDYRNSQQRTFAQHLSSVGTPLWTTDGIQVDVTRAADQFIPVAASDGMGGAIVAWIEPAGSNESIFAQRLNGSGAKLWGASARLVCAANGFRGELSIVPDGREPVVDPAGVVITWQDHRNGNGQPADLYAQDVDGNGTMRWTPNGVPVCTALNDQWFPIVVSDGIGAVGSPKSAIIAWGDDRGGMGDIYAQRLNGMGAPQWTADGMAVCTNASQQTPPAVAYDGSGNALMAWMDHRNGETDIYAQRVGQSASWTADGVPVCRAAGFQQTVNLVADQKGGAIIAWNDARGPDIYAQRIDVNGARKWTLDGVPVSTAPDLQGTALMVSDTRSGAIIAWTDRRSGDEYDLYVQDIDSTGVPRWNPGGVPLCVAPTSQSGERIVSDGSGGAIVLWTDERNGGADLYAQHVTSAGGIVGVEDTRRPESRFGSLRVMPNPAVGATTVEFALSSARRVTARILSVDGRVVRTLVADRALGAGAHRLAWDGLDGAGGRVPSGVYFLDAKAGDETRARRILFLR